jgi:serine/threonine protein kinase/formylglycine-generating enzyme required for sulfatase activity
VQYCPTCNRQYEGDDFVKCPYDGANLVPLDAVGSDPLIGTQFGDAYQIIRIIGEGGMGKVYEARHVRLSKRYAIKILHPQFNSDEQTIARFRREAEAASSIGQENILDVIDFNSTAEGVYYIVTEFLDGRSLARAFAEDGIMKVPRALTILHQMARALKAAHAHEIVHRDLKPENIFLVSRFETDDFVKVLDFGISKVRSGGDRLTQAGQIIGTPHYMSPEQAQGELNLDHRSDVYSFGAIMYEMFTARLPYEGDSVQKILVQLLTEEPPPPRTRRPDLAEDIEAVILKCMDKDPSRRYQTMAELDDAIGLLYGRHVGGKISSTAATAGLETSGEQPAYPGVASGFGTGPTLSSDGVASVPVTSPGAGPASDPGLASSPSVTRPGASTGGWGAAGGTIPTPDPIGQHVTMGDAGKKKGGVPVALILVVLLLLGGSGGALWFFVIRDTGGSSGGTGKGAVAAGMDPASMEGAGMDPMGMDPMGMRPSGMRPSGMEPSGMEPSGMEPSGMDPMGMDPMGMDPPGMRPVTPRPKADPFEGMVLVKGGAFTMGRAGGNKKEGPPQKGVKVDDFYLDATEVSNADYVRYLAGVGKEARSPWGEARVVKKATENLPVTGMTWKEADAYCKALGKGLPTEKQWEYAARGSGHKTLYPWGDKFDATRVVCSVAKPTPLQPVRSGASIGGLFHLSGNAWEWVADQYEPYPGSKAHKAVGTQFVIRGGGAESRKPKELTATWREFNYAHKNPKSKKLSVYRYLGFRCARSPKP